MPSRVLIHLGGGDYTLYHATKLWSTSGEERSARENVRVRIVVPRIQPPILHKALGLTHLVGA